MIYMSDVRSLFAERSGSEECVLAIPYIFFFLRGSPIFLKLGTLKVIEKLFFLIFENCDVTIFKYQKNWFLCRNFGIFGSKSRAGQAFFLGFLDGFPLWLFIKGLLSSERSFKCIYPGGAIVSLYHNVCCRYNLAFRMYCGHSSVRGGNLF